MKYKITKDIFDDAEHFGWNAIKSQRDFYLNREVVAYDDMAITLIIDLTGVSREDAVNTLAKFKFSYYESNGL